MQPYMSESFGNPAVQIIYLDGRLMKRRNCKRANFKCINSNSNEIIFTSGATESINLALKVY